MASAADSARPDAPQPGELPHVFGRYLLLERLSRGGMGEIFLARHGLSGFEKLVVIKKVLPDLTEDHEFIHRFIDEAQVAVKLQHANIAQVFEVGRVGNEYFLAMEYIEGRDLRRALDLLSSRSDRMPPDIALHIAREAAAGLSYAHRRTNAVGDSLELVHCDVSPPNVVMSFEGETKVIDFGIASSALRGADGENGRGFGKYGYLAPEQIIRGRTIDHRTDLYALGVVLFEMLTGRRLYEPEKKPNYKKLARKVAAGDHAVPSDVDRELSRYDDLVIRALRPKPDDRYQSAAEFRDALQQELVDINPTLSQEDLGDYLRALFARDADNERRARAQLESTDIQAWAQELTTHSPSTVSFALASVPEWVAQAENSGRARSATHAAPPAPGRGRVAIAGGVVGAAVAVGAVVAWSALAGGGDGAVRADAGRAGAAVAHEAAPDAAAPVPAVSTPAVDAAAAPPDARPPPDAGRPPAKPPRRRPARRRHRPPPPEPPPADTAPAADEVRAKFRAVLAEYRDFERRYGGRLEQQWADLATYAQFATSEDKLERLDRRLDAFRAEMRRVGGE